MDFDIPKGEGLVNYEAGWFFPKTNLDEVFELQFIAIDRAGNTHKSPRQRLMYDNVVDAPSEPFGVYDPNASGSIGPGLSKYVPYQAGMTVKTNPIRLAYRVPKSNWHTYNEAGLRIVNSVGDVNVVGTDSSYVYITISKPMDFNNNNQLRWVNFGQWGGGTFPYDLVLSSSAPKTPVLLGVDYRYSDVGWSSFYRMNIQNDQLPIAIDRVRVRVEPRPFVQQATHMGSCNIPAGASSCEFAITRNLAKGTTGYLHDIARVWNENKTLVSTTRYAEVNWNDKHYPAITHRYHDGDKFLEVDIYQEGRGSYFDRLRLKDSWLEDASGVRLSVPGGKSVENNKNYTYAWDLTDLPEEFLTLYAVAQENHGPKTRVKLFDFQGDRTPPEIDIVSSDIITSLDDIRIHVIDAIDDSPRITNIGLQGGPADDSVSLSSRRLGDGEFQLEYPIMFPSLTEGEEYTLTVVARDAHRNESSEEVSFIYSPPQVALQGGVDGKLMIPAVQHEFKHLDGRRIIETQPLTLADGSTVAGTYDVFASLRSDAEVPLIVNGVRIEPGDTTQIMSRHDFGASEGRLSLPLLAAEQGLEGVSSLLISTAAPNAPVLLLDVHTWMGEAQLSAEAWEVRQVIDPVRLTATPKNGAMCRFTAAESEARSADPIHDPVCYLQWEALPDETEPVALTDGGANTPQAEGQAVALGEQPVAYSLWLFSGDGSKVKVGEGSRPVNVESPYGSVTLRPREDYSAVDRILHEFDLRLTQSGGPTCSLTLSASEAIEAAANRKHDAQRLTCLLDWQEMPDGLSQKGGTNQPQLNGRLAENGEHLLGWRTSVFSKSGTRVTLNHETTPLVVVDPEAPRLTMTPSRHTTQVDDGRFVVPIAGSYFGDVEINTLPTEVDVRLERDDTVLEAETYGSGWASRNILTRRLQAEGAALWEESEHRVQARYQRVPDIETTQTYRTITGPAANLYPMIALDATEVLDNEPLPIEVTIQDIYATDASYDPSVMGEWDVRLVNQHSLNEREALSDWQYAEDGTARFTLDLEGRDNAGMRLLAEARLRSSIAGYERTEFSQRPTFLTVLRGGALDGDVEIRTLSGKRRLSPCSSSASKAASTRPPWATCTGRSVTTAGPAGRLIRPTSGARRCSCRPLRRASTRCGRMSPTATPASSPIPRRWK